ncbi:hypothetical protein JTE90_003554 [Oedothorax gibbosus]|uniref:Peptidase aspartic putative domain-containing protein n=1 Tax=Oedothorax gibbosus TaxID=931172 RepID=A0AAV6VJ05_9ARAC|nr:hypothetical protein JTE90_003554 [Oedothorax gibbosus]
MNAHERFDYVKKHQLCFRCLSKHLISDCSKAFLKCKFCECNSHNSLIHDAKVSQRKKGNDLESNLEALNPCNDSKGSPPEDVSFFSGNKTPKNNVLLSTAKIRIKNQDGKWIEVISLLDNGSQRNIIRADLAKLLKLKKHAYKANLVGLKNSVVNVNGKVITQISNDEGTFTKNLEFLILPEIAGKTPPEKIDISHLNLPINIKYANSKFYVPQEIPIILGGETFYELFLGNQIRVPGSTVSLIETVFGFVATGCLGDREQTSDDSFCYFVRDSIDDELNQFWRLETIGILPDNDLDEKDLALSHFKNSVTYENGIYSVGLPWKRDYSELSNNLAIARGRPESFNQKIFEKSRTFLRL